MDANNYSDVQNTDYTVGELIAELLEDESWEPDPEYRKKAVAMLMTNVFPSC